MKSLRTTANLPCSRTPTTLLNQRNSSVTKWNCHHRHTNSTKRWTKTGQVIIFQQIIWLRELQDKSNQPQTKKEKSRLACKMVIKTPIARNQNQPKWEVQIISQTDLWPVVILKVLNKPHINRDLLEQMQKQKLVVSKRRSWSLEMISS